MIARIESILRLTPLVRFFTNKMQTDEISLEETVRTLSYASELVVLKLKWLLPNAGIPRAGEDGDPSDEGFDTESSFGAPFANGDLADPPLMEPHVVQVAVSTVRERMEAATRKFARGAAPTFPEGRRLEIARIEPGELKDAMTTALTRTGGVAKTYTVSKWSFATHLRGFWREVRRLTAKGAVLRFSRFLGKSREDTILNFLALLELVKRKRLSARQESLFGDIEFTTTAEGSRSEGVS